MESALALDLWKGGGTQRLFLDGDLTFALLALELGLVAESLHAQDVSEVDTVLEFAGWAWSVSDELLLEEEVLGDGLGTVVDEWRSEGGKDERVQTDDGLDELESQSQPDDGEKGTGWEVEEVGSELVLLQGDLADAGVDVALWFGVDGELGSLLLELLLERIEFLVVHGWLALEVGLDSCKVRGLLSVENDDWRSIPLQILLQLVEVIVLQQLSSGDVVRLKGVQEDALLLGDSKADGASVIIDSAVLLVWDALLGLAVGLEEASGFVIKHDLLACAGHLELVDVLLVITGHSHDR
mmetsp:Transcript_12120/g.33366  ORF Transcript_12120/g.33366 Transcript_12120/m.33366 type:complete len:297 (+) Transcript_12120:1364-2254(+)